MEILKNSLKWPGIAIPDFFQEFLGIVIQENSKFLVLDHLKNSNTHNMIPIAAL
jgi:hypothetical protein